MPLGESIVVKAVGVLLGAASKNLGIAFSDEKRLARSLVRLHEALIETHKAYKQFDRLRDKVSPSKTKLRFQRNIEMLSKRIEGNRKLLVIHDPGLHGFLLEYRDSEERDLNKRGERDLEDREEPECERRRDRDSELYEELECINDFTELTWKEVQESGGAGFKEARDRLRIFIRDNVEPKHLI